MKLRPETLFSWAHSVLQNHTKMMKEMHYCGCMQEGACSQWREKHGASEQQPYVKSSTSPQNRKLCMKGKAQMLFQTRQSKTSFFCKLPLVRTQPKLELNGVWGRVVREKRAREWECMRKKSLGHWEKLKWINTIKSPILSILHFFPSHSWVSTQTCP